MKQFFLFVILLCLPSTFYSQFNPTAEIPLNPKVKMGVLDNGLTYYIQENKKPENKVEMRLAINAGSILEDEDQLGLAHFMEHMNFNGTKNFPDNQLVDFLQSIGIKFGQHLNAFTSFDETVYMLPVPLDKPDNLDKGLLVMEDWAFNALLTDEQIEKERGVVLEELRIGKGPNKRMLDSYLPKIMNGSRYADRLPIGSKELLETFDPKVLRRFRDDWYRPDLMALIIVGDINANEVEEKIKKNFGKYPKVENPRKREVYTVPNNEDPVFAIESDPEASFSRATIYFKSPENYMPDLTGQGFVKEMIFDLVGLMLNNRIKELVNSNNPPFTFGGVGYGGFIARSKEGFTAWAMTDAGKQPKAISVLLEEIERAKQFGFLESELERAKQEMLANLEEQYNNKDKQDSDRIVWSYINHFLEQKPAPGIEWKYEQTKQLINLFPLQALNQVLGSLITDQNRAYVITGPEKDNIEQPTVAMVEEVIDMVASKEIEPYQEGEQIKSLLSSNPVAGTIVKTEADDVLGTKTLTLSNGAKVTYKVTDFKEDEILFRAVSKGGTSVIEDHDEYNSIKWSYLGFIGDPPLLEAGVSGFTKSQLTQYLSDKVVKLSPSISELTERMRGESSKEDFKTLFELIHAYFTSLNFNTEAYQASISKINGIFGNIDSQPGFYFSKKMAEFQNEGNPRFTGIIPTAEQWGKTDFKKAYDLYNKKFGDADDFHFYFVGNINEDELKEYAKTYIASLPSKPESEEWKDDGFRQISGSHEKIIKKGSDPKSQVRISYYGETEYNEKEDLAMEALGAILTIKLIEVLREDEGGVYGAGASGGLSMNPYGNYYFNINFPCGPENVDKLTNLSLAELQKIIDNGPEQGDLDKFVEGEINDYKDKMQENATWINHLTNVFVGTKNKEDILNHQEKLKELTVSDVQAVAKKYVSGDKIIAKLFPEE